MGRLINVQHSPAGPSRLTVEAGDVLMFAATGGRIRSGADVIANLGSFVPGVVGNDGKVYSPAGPPNTVLFVARGQGRATIDVITGDPWHATHSVTLDVVVE
jgi:hypothetical protein